MSNNDLDLLISELLQSSESASQAFLDSFRSDPGAVAGVAFRMLPAIWRAASLGGEAPVEDLLSAHEAIRAEGALLLTLGKSDSSERCQELYHIGCKALERSTGALGSTHEEQDPAAQYLIMVGRVAMAFGHCVRYSNEITAIDDIEPCFESLERALVNADGPPSALVEFKPLINALVDNAYVDELDLLQDQMSNVGRRFAQFRIDASLTGRPWVAGSKYWYWMDAVQLVGQGMCECLEHRRSIAGLRTSTSRISQFLFPRLGKGAKALAT